MRPCRRKHTEKSKNYQLRVYKNTCDPQKGLNLMKKKDINAVVFFGMTAEFLQLQ